MPQASAAVAAAPRVCARDPITAGCGITDEALMRRAQRGEDEAFGTLFDRHARLATVIARQICGPDFAEDATQAAFLSAWKGRGTYSSDHGTFRAWICRISRNRALDVVRANRLPAGNVSADGETLDRHLARSLRFDDPPARLLEQAEERAELRTALDRLPASQREVIELAYYGEMTHSEIAAALDTPSGTIEGRMRLGLTRLRRDPRVGSMKGDPLGMHPRNTGSLAVLES